MAIQWPTYAKFVTEGFIENEVDPSVIRTEMERGTPKQRVLNSDVMCKISGTVMFVNREDIEAFDTWFFDEVKRVNWFDMPHPRTGAMKRFRFIGGKRGDLVPSASFFHLSQRAIELEYMR